MGTLGLGDGRGSGRAAGGHDASRGTEVTHIGGCLGDGVASRCSSRPRALRLLILPALWGGRRHSHPWAQTGDSRRAAPLVGEALSNPCCCRPAGLVGAQLPHGAVTLQRLGPWAHWGGVPGSSAIPRRKAGRGWGTICRGAFAGGAPGIEAMVTTGHRHRLGAAGG